MPDTEKGADQGAPLETIASKHATARLSLAEQFIEFHLGHPEVYEALVRTAREYRRRFGKEVCAIGYLTEITRWEMRNELPADLSIDPAFRAFYARLIMGKEPDLRKFFELRRSAADRWSAQFGGPVSGGFGHA